LLGVLFSRDEAIWFATPREGVAAGTELFRAGSEQQDAAARYRVAGAASAEAGVEAPLVSFDGAPTWLHRVERVSGTEDGFVLGVASTVPIDATMLRECTSREGVHWFVHGPGRWHAYAWLGYDTEASCTDADFE